MAKINQEEYNVLKSLDDKWKWIARDKDTSLWVFGENPIKHGDFWDEFLDACEMMVSDLFQFIQWEDEEPYSIDELFEEYEKESEETEVKKDIEWLKEAILSIEITQFDGYKADLEEFVNSKQIEEIINDWVPEVLSQEWIDGKKLRVKRRIPFHMDVEYAVPEEDLKELLVPKQEEIGVPEWFAEWFEGRGYEMSLYGIFNDLYTNSKSKMDEWSKKYEMGHAELQNDIASIKLHGKGIYEVAEEQKYYVLNTESETMISKNDSGVGTSSGFKIKHGFKNENYKFTEQEIKDYDERYWPFAVKVEEME